MDPGNPAGSFEVVTSQYPLAAQPFTPENAPIEIRARGKRIPQWTLEDNGLIKELQDSPVFSDQPVETLTLIPMGCARLRVSAFPRISDAPEANRWE